MIADVHAFIGIGSNLEDPVQQVRDACNELASLPHSRLLRHSSLYRSAPMASSTPDQPWYVNAVAELATHLSAIRLLDELQAIESRHGRVRSAHWGPRTLDLDILCFGAQRIATERLRVPHPGIAERDFVLRPLLEIAPELEIPGLADIGQMLQSLPESTAELLAPHAEGTSS